MLSIYARMHGHTMIPSIFIVPPDSTDWPKLFHDAKLGSLLATMRSRYRKRSLSSETIAMLEAHKIMWEPLKRSWSGTVTTRMLAEMLSIYARIHGHTKIPTHIIVPFKSNDKPIHMHGAKVGKSLSNMRINYHKQTLSIETITSSP